MQQPKPAPHARKDSAGTISNFQARARGGLRDRTIGDERFSESNGTIKKRKVKEEEVIVISHASDIVISSSSSSSLQVKEEQIEPVKAAKVPVRKSTLSSGEVTNPHLSQIIRSPDHQFQPNLLSFSFHPPRSCCSVCVCDPCPFSPGKPWPPIQLLFCFNPPSFNPGHRHLLKQLPAGPRPGGCRTQREEPTQDGANLLN